MLDHSYAGHHPFGGDVQGHVQTSFGFRDFSKCKACMKDTAATEWAGIKLKCAPEKSTAPEADAAPTASGSEAPNAFMKGLKSLKGFLSAKKAAIITKRECLATGIAKYIADNSDADKCKPICEKSDLYTKAVASLKATPAATAEPASPATSQSPEEEQAGSSVGDVTLLSLLKYAYDQNQRRRIGNAFI